MIPNLPRAGAKCGHLAKAAPVPRCPVSVASRIHAVGEMNHLRSPGRQLIVYVKAELLGRSLPPHPSYVVISTRQQPWVAPVATLGAQTDSPAQAGGKAWLSCPLAALLHTQRKG